MNGLPDTAVVVEARALLERAASPALYSHTLRTFMLARAFGRHRGTAFDEEDLCLAALFHDLGLCPGHRDPKLPFTCASSRAMRAFLAERSWPAERISPLMDAIDFHMQLFPRWSKGPVAGLLQVGAWMDATGRKRRAIAREAEAIAAAVPRGPGQPFWVDALPTALMPRSCVGYLFPQLFRERG